jgi:Tol biopolymer transport system component
MGEVYCATDTNLKRTVAVKVLPEAVATHAERLARFHREAEVLACLNHPNIAAIYGLEKSDGTAALVMELVEGPTLADRIAQGPIPVDDALPIAKQIADALDAAHEQGIIHRDLKPANIKLRPDGTVKVLDFGLAKATAGDRSSLDLSQSPTIAVEATRDGIILGTAAYMSPEQARGKQVDKRTDLWAFGCVLYEMLTGLAAFTRETTTETLAAILDSEPNWQTLPATLPSGVRRLIERCLEKDSKQRLRDIGDARAEIERLIGTPEDAAVSARVSLPVPLWRRVGTATSFLVVGALVAGTAVWLATHPSRPRVARFAEPSSISPLLVTGVVRDLAITPDGTRIVHIGANGSEIAVRALDQLEPTLLTGVGSARSPFVSPDGQWIGFVDAPGVLKKVAITGGPPVKVCDMGSTDRGATWGPHNTIIFATSDSASGLQRVSADGGVPTVLTKPNRERGEGDHLWPEFLPNGGAVLFTITPAGGSIDDAQIAVLDLTTDTQKIVVRGGSHAHYLESGHLVYGAAGTLRAVAFDVKRLEAVGTPVAVIPQVLTTPQGAGDFDIAQDGTLVYVAGLAAQVTLRTLVWVDRQGHEEPIPVPPRPYIYTRLSPDATRIALGAVDEQVDIWIWEITRRALSQFTFGSGVDSEPVWTTNGRRLLFISDRDGVQNLYWQATDGSGRVERLTDSPNSQAIGSVTPDGTRALFWEYLSDSGLMLVTLDQGHSVQTLLQTPFLERNVEISPDGRWVAYEADETGRFEVYVRPFPEVNSGTWRVSTAGGSRPLWARNGTELFYLDPRGALMAVAVDGGSTWRAGTPTRILEPRYFAGAGGIGGRTYDVSPDGQRFLMIRPASGSAPNIIVVQNWTEELKRRLPTN